MKFVIIGGIIQKSYIMIKYVLEPIEAEDNNDSDPPSINKKFKKNRNK